MESSSMLLTQTAKDEQDAFGQCVYLSKKRRRLALLDMLIEAARDDPSLTVGGIQEEVDTFMFAVSLQLTSH